MTKQELKACKKGTIIYECYVFVLVKKGQTDGWIAMDTHANNVYHLSDEQLLDPETLAYDPKDFDEHIADRHQRPVGYDSIMMVVGEVLAGQHDHK